MKRILEIDGGGAKGIITTALLAELEKELGIPIYEIFDLIIGTSVGGIVGGSLASGKLTAVELHNTMLYALPKIFKPRFHIPLVMAKYDREEFDKIFDEIIGKDFFMRDCITKFICTAVNKVDGRTHFFKNWEEKDGKIQLLDAIKRTSAAPYYFKHIRENGNVWLDGGTGNAKCPLGEAIVDIIRLGWMKEEVHILSLGTGYSNKSQPYFEATKWGSLGDTLYYMDPLDGGLARNQSIEVRVNVAYELANLLDNFSFQRIDTEIDKVMDAMDKVVYAEEYEKIGKSLSKEVDIEYLK